MKKQFFAQLTFCVLTAATITLTSCVEEIDRSNRYTFLGETVGSFLEKHDEVYSDFNYVLNRSGVMSLLKAYGTYTCFAPTNEALERFLFEQDSIYRASLLPGSKKVVWTGVTSPNLEELSDSMCTVISNSHVLPATILTLEMEGDVLPARNLNDRYLTMTYGVDSLLRSVLYVNGSEIISSDEEVENGVIHTVSSVLNPSTNTVPTQIKDMPFLSIFSEALEMTGLENDLQLYKDESYTDWDKVASNADMSGNPMRYPPSRYYGYTAFCEPDYVFQDMGIFNIDDLYKQCKLWYPEATDPDFKHENNALHKFIAYHLLNYHLLYTRLVFFNLKASGGGVAYNSEVHYQTGSDRAEYYETMQGTMLKIMVPRSSNVIAHEEDGTDRQLKNTIFLNFSHEALNLADPLHTTVGKKSIPVGVRVMNPTEVGNDPERFPGFNQEALNGSIHLIDRPLVYDEDVMAGYVLNGVIRLNYDALVPELTNNHIRWYDGTAGLSFPAASGFFIPDGYSDYVKVYSDECRLSYYAPNDGYDEHNGDFCICKGQFDFAYRLPRVPKGTYEIRVSYIAGSERGIVQFYVDNEITGIPVDNRIYSDDPRIGFVDDSRTDDNGVANDKEMKNRGYLKLPITYRSVYMNGPARRYSHGLRLVVTTKYLTDDIHWIRIKNVHESDSGSDFYNHDYVELVPVSWLRREDLTLDQKRQ
ncbi:MAG: fasciclin domain-containing protein [Bacteroidaceae bacterium]|nr:fasciclin domain-containing protein [Bacteroidaceae bacterium]MBP5322294.1 fasciclin domain-containing protein [Bacteroidaceae bacterium]